MFDSITPEQHKQAVAVAKRYRKQRRTAEDVEVQVRKRWAKWMADYIMHLYYNGW